MINNIKNSPRWRISYISGPPSSQCPYNTKETIYYKSLKETLINLVAICNSYKDYVDICIEELHIETGQYYCICHSFRSIFRLSSSQWWFLFNKEAPPPLEK